MDNADCCSIVVAMFPYIVAIRIQGHLLPESESQAVVASLMNAMSSLPLLPFLSIAVIPKKYLPS